MNFKEKLYKYVSESHSHYFTAKQLCSALGANSVVMKKEVKSALTKLCSEGSLRYDKRNDRYFAVSNEELFTAEVDGNARGFGFLLTEKGDLFVPPKSMRGALNKDKVLARRVPNTADEAEIIKIVSRGVTETVGVYDKHGGKGFVILDDKKFSRDVYVPAGSDMHAKNGQKVVVKITSYPENKCPEGRIVQILGYPDEENVDMISVAVSFGIPTEFPTPVIMRADKLPRELTEKDIEGRRDLRNEIQITIDGADAKDLDDAVSVSEKSDGTFTLGVHIADVSAYVRAGDEIDKDAFERGNSVYLPDLVFPMLPVQLSNGICSLYEQTDRLTLSCVMEINRDGKVVDYDIFESVIRSRHRMTYDEVQAVFDEDIATAEKYSDVKNMLFTAKKLCELLSDKRDLDGNIDFKSEEVTFVTENGEVTDIVPFKRTFAHKLIEEFMIAANETVAAFAEKRGCPFLYRVHEQPDREKTEILSALLSGIGINLDVGQNGEPSGAAFSQALIKAKETKYGNLINDVMLRTMQKAKYDVVNKGHFGLASLHYCHFTSPIRRYPDLVVHRIVKTLIEGKMTEKAQSAYREMCSDTCVRANVTEKRADDAERKADDVKKCRYASKLLGDVFDAVISGVTENGIFAELINTVEGFIPIERLPDDVLNYDAAKFCLSSQNAVYALGDRIKIKVESVNLAALKIEFSLTERIK